MRAHECMSPSARHEALQAFLQRYYGAAHFIGAETPKATTTAPPLVTNTLTTDDAAALVPLIRGAFKLNSKRIIPLQRPLLGLRLPKTSLKDGNWKNLQVAATFKLMTDHMAGDRINFYDTISKADASQKRSPFAQALHIVDSIELTLLQSLIDQKDQIIANAVTARSSILSKVADLIRGNDAGSKDLFDALTHDWNTTIESLRNEPVEHILNNFTDDHNWQRLSKYQEFWKQFSSSEDSKAKAKSAFESDAKIQETYQLDAAIASIKLQLLYYKKLNGFINTDGFSKHIFENVLKKAFAAGSNPVRVGVATKYEWKIHLSDFLGALLLERLELLQANIFTYFTAILGQGQAAEEHTSNITTHAVFATFSAFFDVDMALQSLATDSPETLRKKDIIRNSLEKGSDYAKFREKILKFFKVVAIQPLTADDQKGIVGSIDNLVTGQPARFQKSIIINNLSYTSVDVTLKQNLSYATLPFIASPGEKGDHGKKAAVVNNGPSRFPTLKLSKKIEVTSFTKYFNEGIGGASTNNIALNVAANIIHAVGLGTPAFVSSFYANSDTAPNEYFSVFPSTLYTTTEIIDSKSPFLTRPAWFKHLEDKTWKDKDITTITGTPKVLSLFVVKSTIPKALTRPNSARSTRSEKKSGAAGAAKKGGNNNNQPKAGKQQNGKQQNGNGKQQNGKQQNGKQQNGNNNNKQGKKNK